ncbi:MAG TPA: TspO/MBR family protein [Lacunisphaera sp.]
MIRRQQWLGLVGWLALVFANATVGATASIQAAPFYGTLVRPSWAPPGWLFAPVWNVLYLLMAIAAWLVWREGSQRPVRGPLALFVVQLVLNGLWSWLFFAWREGRWAFIEIIVLWCLILATVVAFWRVRNLAGALLLPYLAWVSFATALAYQTWQLNPSALGP